MREYDPPDTTVSTGLAWHICPAGSQPSCGALAQLPFQIKDPALFAPACQPVCQLWWAKPIEITITDLHGLCSLTVCCFALTETSFMSIHKYVTENNCLRGLLAMFTLHDDWQDKLWQWRGGKVKVERRFWEAVLVIREKKNAYSSAVVVFLIKGQYVQKTFIFSLALQSLW